MNLLDIIFPKNCLECGSYGKYMCSLCLRKSVIIKTACPECKKPSIDGFTHIKCQKKYGLDGLMSMWRYDGVIRKAIIGLKYKYAREIEKELVSYVVEELENKKFIFGENVTVIPIPLYWYRENNRGFNQAETLGWAMATAMKWEFDSGLLKRKKYVPPQVGLKVKERRANVKSVFSLNSETMDIGSDFYILFDDVYTTGSTLKEAAKVLKRTGVEKVWGLTIAK